jgi:hypothetical protein
MNNTPPSSLSQGLSGNEARITSWQDFQKEASYFAKNRGQWCFRGQRDAKWGLTPSLERLVGKDRIPAALVERVFLTRFKRQAHHYLQRIPHDDSTLEWLALMQHWGVPTRLLDFTLSPYLGLFFAIVDMEPKTEQAALWAIRYTWLNMIASRKEPLRFHELFDAAFKRQSSELKFVAPIQPFIMNERLAVQQGMFLCPFTLSLGFEQTIVQTDGFQEVIQSTNEIDFAFARKFVITKAARCELLRELHRMNITSASLFPGLGGFAQSLKESYEALGDVEPRLKDFELGAIEDFGWSG